jgi:hypothetical protein
MNTTSNKSKRSFNNLMWYCPQCFDSDNYYKCSCGLKWTYKRYTLPHYALRTSWEKLEMLRYKKVRHHAESEEGP